MIQNEKEYRITKTKIADMLQKANEIKPHIKLQPYREGAYLSLIMLKNQLQAQVKAYEKKKLKPTISKSALPIFQFPKILINYKIAQNLSQKSFAAILGIKEQQLQRYEAEQYASVSFKRLMSFVEKTNLKVTVTVKSS